MKKALYIVMGPALALLLSYAAMITFGPRSTPAGQPRLSDLNARGFQKLFNASAHQTRVLVILSPT